MKGHHEEFKLTDSDVELINNRLQRLELRFRSLENTVLDSANEVALIKHRLASISGKYAVSIREKERNDPLAKLKKDLSRMTGIDITDEYGHIFPNSESVSGRGDQDSIPHNSGVHTAAVENSGSPSNRTSKIENK